MARHTNELILIPGTNMSVNARQGVPGVSPVPWAEIGPQLAARIEAGENPSVAWQLLGDEAADMRPNVDSALQALCESQLGVFGLPVQASLAFLQDVEVRPKIVALGAFVD